MLFWRLEDFEENPEIYAGRYLMFTGIIHSTASSSTYFVKEDGSRSDVMLYYTTLKDNGEPVQFIATIIRFNNLIEMLRDPLGMDNYEHYFTEQEAN